MKIKIILSIAIIVALPFVVMADPQVGPAEYSGNNPVVATGDAPYATAEITNDDKTNIASTAYVKDAYNDTIAAVNKINDKVKQVRNDVAEVENNVLTHITIYEEWRNDHKYGILDRNGYHDSSFFNEI